MAKLPAAKGGYLKTTTEFSQLGKDISLLQRAMLLQIYMRFEVVVLSQVWTCGKLC